MISAIGRRLRASPGVRTRHRNSIGVLYWIILYLMVGAGAIVFVLPFWWMVRTSIMPAWQVFQFPPAWIPAQLDFSSWSFPFQTGYNYSFMGWIWNSVFIGVFTALGAAISASLVGFGFARLRFRGRDFLFVVVLATMILPEHVRLVPTYLLMVKLHWINSYNSLIVPNWLAPAFFVFLMRQFFMTIPKELDDAGLIDGCSPWGLFWRIHVPLSMAALGVVAIFAFTDSWNDFIHPLLYLQHAKIFTVSLGLRLFQTNYNLQLQGLMAASILSMIPPIALFFVAQRSLIQGIVVTGVKG